MQPSAKSDPKILAWEDIPSVTAIPDEPVEWLCETLIPRGGITLLAGEPSACKTWLALTLAKAIAGGVPFLGLRSVRAPVLYLDRENPAGIIRDRLARLGIDFESALRHSNFKYWGGWQPDVPPGIGDFRLKEFAVLGPLIILDPFVRFHGRDENSASEMANVMGELRQLAFRGASVMALHHKSKAEASKYRGSSDIAAGVDVGIALSKDQTSGILKLTSFKNRMGTDFTYNIRPDFGSDAVTFSLTEAPEVDESDSLKIKLLTVIAENEGMAQREVIRRAQIPENRGKQLLRDFEGQLWMTKTGAHNARLYYTLERKEAELVFSS